MFDDLPNPRVLGLSPDEAGLPMLAILFLGALLRAGLCARAARASRRAHFWAFVGLVETIGSVALMALLSANPLPGGIHAPALYALIVLRLAGLGLISAGFFRASVIGGRAAWVDWLFTAVFTVGLLAFAAVLYKNADRLFGLVAGG